MHGGTRGSTVMPGVTCLSDTKLLHSSQMLPSAIPQGSEREGREMIAHRHVLQKGLCGDIVIDDGYQQHHNILLSQGPGCVQNIEK